MRGLHCCRSRHSIIIVARRERGHTFGLFLSAQGLVMALDSPGAVLAVAVIVVIASLIQGAIGFGFGLFSVAALALVTGLKTSTPFLALVNLPAVVYVFWQLHDAVRWRRLVSVLVGLLLGIPFGIFVLVHWPEELLLRILGAVLLVAAARSLCKRCEEKPVRQGESHRWWGVAERLVVGMSSGALAGAFNVGGPPVIAYVYSRPWTKEQRTASLQAAFFISVLVRIVLMAGAGLYTHEIVRAALLCTPGAVLGTFAGYAIFRRISRLALELVVSGFLLVTGIKFLLWP